MLLTHNIYFWTYKTCKSIKHDLTRFSSKIEESKIEKVEPKITVFMLIYCFELFF